VNTFFTDIIFDDTVEISNRTKIELKNNLSLKLVNENTISNKKDISSISSLFILIDINQVGFANKQLLESKLQKLTNLKITWVVQSIKSLVNSESLIEAFIEFESLLKDINMPLNSILVSDKDPFYSGLFYKLFFDGEKLINAQNEIMEEQNWIKLFSDSFELKNSSKREKLGKLLKAYKTMHKSGEKINA